MKKQYLSLALLTLFVIAGMFSCSKSNDVKASKGTITPKETILYQTNFSNDDGKWVVGDISKGGSTYYQNGNYVVVGGNDINTFTYSYTDNFFANSSGNIAIQASIKAISTFGANHGNAGLIWDFRSSGPGNASYYVFEINYSGLWGIYQYQLTNNATNQWAITTVAAMVANSAVKPNDFNTLQIKQSNGQLQFSINNTQVYKMNETGGDLDQAGLFADVSSKLQANLFEAEVWQ